MALGPNAIEIRADILKIAEAKIDDAIRAQNFNSSENVNVGLSLLPQMTKKEWQEIKERYRAVGWSTAEVIHEQRDGNYFHLSVEQRNLIRKRLYDEDGDK